ncbi:type I-F CRISPR-associated protein Csy1 [Stenotrophomonas mori]|uniref:Type I-F CRISPR-associated protein Csy1 n=1 Tax=Stenotrophomonas mori TaxID=2871096 RepID=A0ABT0SKF2_9GAMM|nr:type I-F CRISPR-associated protein Csy1 [Stenotrophomonas mori]MCL7715818.1 type I-F CRISPR-associated protein Csy1 [Stenotrophomonas mori]
MQSNPAHAPSGFRAAIDQFIQDRLVAKLDKLADDDPKRTELFAQHQRATWLEDAARRVRQIQAVTHSLKPIHPDARGTNLYLPPTHMRQLDEVGSHVLGNRFDADVVGNAAALDVYKLLKLQVNGQTLLDALAQCQADALAALSDNVELAKAWRDAFVSLIGERDGPASSHERAKQLYWLAGDDPCEDRHYHLLAPLYATSLAHVVHRELQEHRFGEANKEARQARRDGKVHDGIHHHYPDLAVQKLGGTKPQNISQLNSERGGINYLLSSLPPVWKSSDFRLPARTTSVFDRLFSARPEVHRTLRRFSAFLASKPDETMETRDRVDAFVERLIDEATIMAGGFHRALPGGWSRDEQYTELAMEEKLWLDPLRAELAEEHVFAHDWLWMDWPAAIGKRFAHWLNARLQGRFPVGDAEHRQWKKLLRVDESEDGWAKQLHRLRKKLEAPTCIPTHNTHDGPVAREVQA